MMDDSDIAAVVIDNGSHTMKAGFGGYDAPRDVIPTILGHPRYQMGENEPESFIGEKAHSERNILALNYPIEHSLITNWDDMEEIWHHIYNELRVTSEGQPIFLTEPIFNPKGKREKMAEVFFETFYAPAMQLCNSSLAGILSSRCTTGIVLDVGGGSTKIIPVHEGKTIPKAAIRFDIGGRDLTDYLGKLIVKQGYSFKTHFDQVLADDIKNKLCYVADDFNKEIESSSSLEQCYDLPKGEVLKLGNERFQCPEALFQPSLLGINSDGIHEMLYKSITKCDTNIRRDLYSNIVVIGGSTMYPGFAERMQKEITSLAPRGINVKVIAPPEGNNSVWLGASILASSLPTFQPMWITKKEYEETGASIVHTKDIEKLIY